LGGWPSAAEDIIVSRDIILAKYTNSHIHLQHISSAYSIDLIRQAKKRGISVSAEATPHHLALTDACLKDFDTNYKMCPPLRSEEDRKALIKGVVDGSIEVIATDHAPHTETEKDREFNLAPFGITGFETAFSVCHDVLVRSKKIDMLKLVKLMSTRPAELLGIDAGTLKVGSPADFVLIDENAEYFYNSPVSRSSNSPWLNKKLKGRVVQTFVGGKLVYKA
jgi:dihydroorotase